MTTELNELKTASSLLALCLVLGSCSTLGSVLGLGGGGDHPDHVEANSSTVASAAIEAVPAVVDAGSNFLFTLLMIIIVASVVFKPARIAFGITTAAFLTWVGDWFRAKRDKKGRALDRVDNNTDGVDNEAS